MAGEGERGGWAADEALHEPLGEGRATRPSPAATIRTPATTGVLEQEAARARDHRVVDELVEVEGGEDEHACRQAGTDDVGSGPATPAAVMFIAGGLGETFWSEDDGEVSETVLAASSVAWVLVGLTLLSLATRAVRSRR